MADIKDYIKKLQDGTVSVEEQQFALAKIEETIKIAKQKRDEAVGQKAEMVIEALRQIEDRLNAKYEELLQTPALVGEQGPQGPAGKDGKDGLNGRDGKDGIDGKDGKDGSDGKDGVSVVDATVDFDGSLVITLSDGNQIDAGQIFSPEVAQNIQIFRGGGGGTSLPDQTGNSGKYLTTDGSQLSWATVSGGGGGSGTVTSVAMTVPTGLTVSGSPITTSGTLAVSLASGYAIPTTAKQTEWDTAYGWGNHASASYLTTAVTSATAGTGISVSASTGAVTFTNTAPDQVVSLNQGGTTTITGTYPNFTISSADQYTGTVTSITAGTGLTGGTITGSGTIAIDSTVATLTGTQTLSNKTITNLIMDGYIREEIFAVSGTTPALSPSNGTIQTWTLSGNSTPTQGTWNNGESLTLMILDGTAFTITWTSLAVTWVGGSAPTLDTTKYTVIELWEVGGVIYGALVGAA